MTQSKPTNWTTGAASNFAGMHSIVTYVALLGGNTKRVRDWRFLWLRKKTVSRILYWDQITRDGKPWQPPS